MSLNHYNVCTKYFRFLSSGKELLEQGGFRWYHTIVLAKTSPHAREDVDKRLGIL